MHRITFQTSVRPPPPRSPGIAEIRREPPLVPVQTQRKRKRTFITCKICRICKTTVLNPVLQLGVVLRIHTLDSAVAGNQRCGACIARQTLCKYQEKQIASFKASFSVTLRYFSPSTVIAKVKEIEALETCMHGAVRMAESHTSTRALYASAPQKWR